MILSDRHRFVFVELPRTGSTAIARELQETYDARPILRKHAYYVDFLRHARAEQRSYFVFSGVRNPLESIVSVYVKLRTNHKDNYTDPSRWQSNGGWVPDKMVREYRWIQQQDASFEQFLQRRYKLPVESWASMDHHRFDFVYRFERLQEDFTALLEVLDIPQVRALPRVNPTAKKKPWQDYFEGIAPARIRYWFGPVMREMGYAFPEEWGIAPATVPERVLHRGYSRLKNGYRRYLQRRPLPRDPTLQP